MSIAEKMRKIADERNKKNQELADIRLKNLAMEQFDLTLDQIEILADENGAYNKIFSQSTFDYESATFTNEFVRLFEEAGFIVEESEDDEDHKTITISWNKTQEKKNKN